MPTKPTPFAFGGSSIKKSYTETMFFIGYTPRTFLFFRGHAVSVLRDYGKFAYAVKATISKFGGPSEIRTRNQWLNLPL